MPPADPTLRDPAAEAQALVGERRLARVLEPSPPAVDVAPWFADDPAACGEAPPGIEVVTPSSAGDVTWSELAADDAGIAAYAGDHWLVISRTLPRVPDGYVEGRDDFHRVAYAVVSEARRLAVGRFGLRYTHLGFGTPFFGDGEQVRVEGTHLVVQTAGSARRAPLTTIRAAGELVGVAPTDGQAEHDSPRLGDIDRPLRVDEAVGAFLGDWFGFAFLALEELRVTSGATHVSRAQLWPGHFDAAVDMGDERTGRRATYGASPGDADHPEPYLYVSPWGETVNRDPYWNDVTFGGASLPYADLRTEPDPVAATVEFYRRGHALAGQRRPD